MSPRPSATTPAPPPPPAPTPHAGAPGFRLSAGGRTGRIAGLGAIVAVTLTVALTDPSRTRLFPPCPSRTLLGLDCPACGGLRGTHDLLGGRVGDALDHNLLLPGLLLAFAAGLALWLAPLAGRAVPAWRPPRWLAVTAFAVVAAFTVARNLPVDALTFLASG
ncbi:MAG TPA: DUF2752 domain-containing protein [Acidimicrobiales bacterium]